MLFVILYVLEAYFIVHPSLACILPPPPSLLIEQNNPPSYVAKLKNDYSQHSPIITMTLLIGISEPQNMWHIDKTCLLKSIHRKTYTP